MITIVDYGLGNLGSILNMLKRIGVKGEIRSDREGIQNSTKLILPGVGAFDAAMHNLQNSGWLEILNKKVLEEKTPIMGICLGMQLLFNSSEEGNEQGLGWIPGSVKKFTPKDRKLKVPHMGWNYVQPDQKHQIIDGMDNSKFYFVHSYYVSPNAKEHILLTTQYGESFCSGAVKDNIYGFQFHPEKSHKYGMQLLKNFSTI